MVALALALLSLLPLGMALERRVCSGPHGNYPCFGSVPYTQFEQSHLTHGGATHNESDVECLYIPNKTMPRDCKEARIMAGHHWVANGTFVVHKDECIYVAHNTCRFSICALEKDRPLAAVDSLPKMNQCEDKCSMQGCRWNGNVLLTLTHDL